MKHSNLHLGLILPSGGWQSLILINTGVKNEQHLNKDKNFDHEMSISKKKCLYSYNCLQFLKRAVPFEFSKAFFSF
jgi:hypothetical protein